MFTRISLVFVISMTSQVCDSMKEPEASSDPDATRCSTLGDVNNNKNECGYPLMIEPYFQKGYLMEAKNKSEVKSDMFLGVKSYSGFLTVNSTYNSNLFFWYFPIENQKVSKSFSIIRLPSGRMLQKSSPCLDGVFEEVGPFKVEGKNITHNPYSWHKHASLVFIDSPVGSGYSFTDHPDGFATDMATYLWHLKLAIGKLLQVFPELKTAPLIIAGESIGGKYAAALALELHKAKMEGLQINLQGIFTGNSFLEASMLTQTHKTFHHFGLISKEDFEGIQPLINDFDKDITNNRSLAAYEKWGKVLRTLLRKSNQSNANNLIDKNLSKSYKRHIQRSCWFKKAIHVGNTNFSYQNLTVDKKLANEFLTSARPFYEKLLNLDYSVTTYCGMFDLILPCYLESEQHLKWRWNSSEQFRNATQSILYDSNGTLTAYYKGVGNLIEVQFEKGGHFVSRDNPEGIQDYISILTSPPLTAEQELEWDEFQRKELLKKNQDTGTRLMLTPYLDKGLYLKAKRLCEVDSNLFLGVKSYSGFLTVNSTYNSNLFFWYFPIENQNVTGNPWIIWLQGGQRLQGMSSSLDGVFEEVGPFKTKENFIKRNPYSWHQNVSLLLIDSPVGSGFSFTDHPDGFVTDMDTYMVHLTCAVKQLLQIFPELSVAPLTIAGESLGGKYASALAVKLHDEQIKGYKINFQILITGNSFLVASMLTQTAKTFHDSGKISEEDVTRIQPLIDDFAKDITNNRSVAASDKWGKILDTLLIMSGQTNANNTHSVTSYNWLLYRSDFRKAIHVANTVFSYRNSTVDTKLANDFLTSATPFYETMLSRMFFVVTYCGMLDLILPCSLASEQHRKFRFNFTSAFERYYYEPKMQTRKIEILKAGHFVSRDTPQLIFELVSNITQSRLKDKWTANKNYKEEIASYNWVRNEINKHQQQQQKTEDTVVAIIEESLRFQSNS